MTIYVMQGTTLAGKTQHGRRLAKDFGMEYVSSGDIARSLMDDATRSEFAQGKLSPHDEKIRMAIYAKIVQANLYGDNILLDGFPRIPMHVIDFMTWRRDFFEICPKIVVIKIETCAALIVERGTKRQRDTFDTPETILKRHTIYRDETEPALDFMSSFFGSQVLVTLNHEAEIDNVYEAIVGELKDNGHIG